MPSYILWDGVCLNILCEWMAILNIIDTSSNKEKKISKLACHNKFYLYEKFYLNWITNFWSRLRFIIKFQSSKIFREKLLTFMAQLPHQMAKLSCSSNKVLTLNLKCCKINETLTLIILQTKGNCWYNLL